PPSLLLQSLEKMILDKADTFNSMHISMILRSFSLLSAVHSPSADFFLKLGERSLEIIDEFTGDQAYVALSALPSPQH
ncbi:MAG: hypothetical protein Q8P67_18385, partial [archaeon]|nr:hypothetical protein [archaeon]